MQSLKERLTDVMLTMQWEHADLVRISKQSSSVVSQWLGNGSKEIKTIGKLEAAIYIERMSGFSALWVAKGIGPKRVQPGHDRVVLAGESSPRPYGPAAVLDELQALLRTVPPDMQGAFADVLAGWARSGGADDRKAALLALLNAPDKGSQAA